MNGVTIFWMQILASVFVFGIIAVWYVRPQCSELKQLPAKSTGIPDPLAIV